VCTEYAEHMKQIRGLYNTPHCAGREELRPSFTREGLFVKPHTHITEIQYIYKNMFIVVDICRPLKRAKPLCEHIITSRPIRKKAGGTQIHWWGESGMLLITPYLETHLHNFLYLCLILRLKNNRVYATYRQ
jgi:hypothetical protein